VSERAGITWVLAAPSGTGKTTLCREILERDTDVTLSVSHTTRSKRPEEGEGRHYHFVDAAEFGRLVAADTFLEHAEYNDHQYGTSWGAIDAGASRGRDVLLEIEVQGARQVRDRLPGARLIFVLPPSMRALEQRLEKRGTDSERAMRRRLDAAGREIGELSRFDYAVTNSEISECVDDILAIIRAERSGDPETIAALRERFSPKAAEECFRRTGG
jgi:guanylate kinase